MVGPDSTVSVGVTTVALASAVSPVGETVSAAVTVVGACNVGISVVALVTTGVNVGRNVAPDMTVGSGRDTRRETTTAPTKTNARTTPMNRAVTKIVTTRLLLLPLLALFSRGGLLSLVIDSTARKGT
jgi:hypothetical protein